MKKKMSDKEFNKLIQFDKDIYNKAIDDAAKIASEYDEDNIADQIRKLKK